MNFNHISKRLTEGQVSALTSLYFTYHKQYWCYKKMFKRHKRLDLALKLSSVILTTTGAMVGTVTLNPMILACVSRTGDLLQTITTHINVSNKKQGLQICFSILSKITQHFEIMFKIR